MERISLRYLLILFTFSLTLAQGFMLSEIDGLYVSVELKEDGSVSVTETYHILMETNEVPFYESGFLNNDIASWRTLTGLDIKHHLNRAYVTIENIKVKPQSVSSCNDLTNICRAYLVISYTGKPIDNETKTIVFVENTKPRTTEYTLNPKIFEFATSETDNLILDEKTTLEISIPERADIIDINPLPDGVTTREELRDMTSFSWKGTTLVEFEFVYEIEKTIEEEIAEFFEEKLLLLGWLFGTEEGKILLFVAAVFVIWYVYLQRIKSKRGA